MTIEILSFPTREQADAMRERLESVGPGGPGLDAEVREILGLPDGYDAPLTTSLDAALDLIEAVLPGWSVDMQGNRIPNPRDTGNMGRVALYVSTSAPRNPGGYSPGFVPATVPAVGATRALSALAALFASLASDKFDRNAVRPKAEPGYVRTVAGKLFELTLYDLWEVVKASGLQREGDSKLGDTDLVLSIVERAREAGGLSDLARLADEAAARTH